MVTHFTLKLGSLLRTHTHSHTPVHAQPCGHTYTCLHIETEIGGPQSRGEGREEGGEGGGSLYLSALPELRIFADELLGRGAWLRSWKVSHSREGKGERGRD